MSDSDYSEQFSPNPQEKAKATTARGVKPPKNEAKFSQRKSDKGLVTIEDVSHENAD
jgi:hypothetical protein